MLKRSSRVAATFLFLAVVSNAEKLPLNVLKLKASACKSSTLTSALFLKIADIPGDSRDFCHRDEIEVRQFQYGGNSMTVWKKIDITSPHLFIAALTGRHIPQAVLTVLEQRPQPRFVIYKMKDAIVTAIDQTAGSTSNEQIVLRFQSMEMETESASATAPAPGAAPGFNISMKISTLGSASFAVSLLNDGASGGQLHDLMINKSLDTASPKLMLAFQSGQHLPEITFTLTPAGGGEPLMYKLTDVVVAADTQQGSASSQTELVRLKPSRITIEYHSNTRGPVKAGYDVKANKAV
jgi:type VI protein secretion system component Hcp